MRYFQSKPSTMKALMLQCVALWLLTCSVAVMAEDGGNSTADAHLGDDEEEHIEPVTQILFPWFANIIGVICFYLIARYCHVLPYTAVMFCVGTCMGVGYARLNGTSQLAESLFWWENINGELLLLTFLPGLLFKDAYCSNVHLMALAFNQCLVMAFPMVLAGAALTACVAFYIFPYDWPFSLAMTLGSILAATDPVAVSALLEEVGAPPRLKVHISGESLFNDGSAMVFYTVFSEIFLYSLGIPGLGEDVDLKEGVKIFCLMAFGGCVLGILFGLATCLILFLLNRKLNSEENVVQIVATITMAYLTFYIAEPVSHTSGVIAVVFCGFTTRAFGQDMINDVQSMNSFWVLVEHILNTVLFALGGLVWGSIIANVGSREGMWTGQDWAFLFVLYVFLILIRFFLFASFYPINSRLGLKSNWQEMVFQSYGGLRGAVGIALAILLDDQVFSSTENELYRSYTTKVFGMVGGIAFLTLVINGTLAGPFLVKLGLAEDTDMRRLVVEKYDQAYTEKLLTDFVHLLMDPLYQGVNFAIVQQHIPEFADVTKSQILEAVARNKARTPALIYREPDLTSVYKALGDDNEDASAQDQGKQGTAVAQSGQDTIPGEEPPKEEPAVVKGVSGAAASSPIASTPEDQEKLTIELRKIFCEMLRSAYHKLIEAGELDGREGFTTYALFEGLDFANDQVENGEALKDWEMTASIMNSWTEPIDRYITKMFRGISACARRNSKETRKQTFQNVKQLNPQIEKALGAVRLSIGFTRAHEIAEESFKREMEVMGAPEAETLILEESQSQVALAKEVFDRQEDTGVIVSHLACVIVINKGARYVERLVHNGLLKEGEGSEFLETLQEYLVHLDGCPTGAHDE